jgi:hypothetical protein
MDAGVKIARGNLDHGEWLQGRRHVIDTITGRKSAHMKSGKDENDIKESPVTYITMTSIFFRPKQL